MEQVNIITTYIATWGWQLQAMAFLIASFIFFALPRTTITQAFYVATFLVFVFCLYKMLSKKTELKQLEKEQNE